MQCSEPVLRAGASPRQSGRRAMECPNEPRIPKAFGTGECRSPMARDPRSRSALSEEIPDLQRGSSPGGAVNVSLNGFSICETIGGESSDRLRSAQTETATARGQTAADNKELGGRDSRIRTGDLRSPRAVRYRTAPCPEDVFHNDQCQHRFCSAARTPRPECQLLRESIRLPVRETVFRIG